MEFVYKINQALKLVIFTRINDINIYENWISLYFFLVRTGKFPCLVNILSFHYSRVPNISVVPINSVGGGKFPKFNNSVGVFTYVMYCLIIV